MGKVGVDRRDVHHQIVRQFFLQRGRDLGQTALIGVGEKLDLGMFSCKIGQIEDQGRSGRFVFFLQSLALGAEAEIVRLVVGADVHQQRAPGVGGLGLQFFVEAQDVFGQFLLQIGIGEAQVAVGHAFALFVHRKVLRIAFERRLVPQPDGRMQMFDDPFFVFESQRNTSA